MTLLLPLLAFLGIFALTITLFVAARRRAGQQEQLARRLESLGQPQRAATQSLLQDKTFSDIPQLNRLLAKTPVAGWFDRMVMQAGFQMRAGAMLLWFLLIGTAAALVMHLMQGQLLVTTAALVGGPALGVVFLRRQRSTRRQAIVRQLPDTLEMMRSALQAGYSLQQALEAICEEVPDPMQSELRQLTEELRLGHPMRAAFQGLYERTGIEDLRYFIVAVLVNRDVGGNLSEIIEVVAGTVRERFKLKAQIRALTAQGRFSALVLCSLTPTLLGALTLLNPAYLQPMYHTRMGQMALGYAAVSTIIGYALMRRIVNIKLIRID